MLFPWYVRQCHITWDGARAPQDLRQEGLAVACRSSKHPRSLVADVIVGARHLHIEQQTKCARSPS
jgi:hypothetical protein